MSAQLIQNIRYAPLGEDMRDKYMFEYAGQTCIIAAPASGALLSNNDASRNWILTHYGFLLAFLTNAQ